MPKKDSRPTEDWKDFGRRWDWGKPLTKRESKKARKKRLCGASANKQKIKKKKKKNQQYNQISMNGNNITLNDAEAFGDIQKTKSTNTVRIGLQNMQNLPESAKHYKSRQAVDCIKQSEYDVFLISETGLCWPKLDASDQWFERVLGKLHDSYATFAHNDQELAITEKVQYGGVGIVASSDMKHRIIDSGKDPSGLGRWVWIRLRGKENHTTRLVSAYRPCQSDGASTVYQQHRRILSARGDHRDPLAAFIQDLRADIDSWKSVGDHLVIGMDANEDVRTGEIGTLLGFLGMREAILDLHSDQNPPATHNRNQQRQPIDGIWVSQGIQIAYGGYSAFGDACPSDHRALWIDIIYSVMFGQIPEQLWLPTARKLNTRDPRLIQLYNNRANQVMIKSGFQQRFAAFKARHALGEWSNEMIALYNVLQQENSELRRQVEDDLRKLKMGGVPWSPKLQIYRNEIELWRMLLQRRKGLKTSVSRIRRFMKKTGLALAFTFSIEEIQGLLTLAYKAYKLAKKDSANWRNDHLSSLAQAKADEKGTNEKMESRNLIRIERQRRQARNVKRMNGKLTRSRVTQVFYTDKEGQRVVCNTQLSMVRACINENEARFSQTEYTPPMTPPLSDALGRYGETVEAQAILDGTYEAPKDTDKYAIELLEALRIPKIVLDAGPVTLDLTLAEHCQGWRRQREATASEPTGLPFSHYKAAAHNTTLSEVDRFLRNIPYCKGFSPTAWQFITDVELLKKVGVFDIEKMRTIQLMHSEFNMNNKKLGRDMMSFAERCNVLAPEQFGSRKNHQSIIAALNKRLTMDVIRQRRQPGALCSNDAKSCYDRIVHSVAALSMRRLGVPQAPLTSMFLTLQNASHAISTAYGVSKESYGTGRSVALQGVGQGNGAGPAIWAAISTVIINMMRAAGHGLNLVSAISGILLSFVCYAFVDDTDVIHVAISPLSTGEDVLLEMQTVVDRWEGGIRATGGALVPSKSCWFLIDFLWTGTKWRYRTMNEMPGDISVLDKDGRRTNLDRHDASSATETLGVWQAMDGNNAKEVESLRKKTENFAESMRTGTLSKADAWYALNTTILKTLEYPMAATTITEKEWEYIMAPVLLVGLPRSGIARNFPRDVLYGPKTLQGFGILHPWYNQELTHLITSVQQSSLPSIAGGLLSTSLEQLRLEVGLPGFVTDHDYEIVQSLLTPCWLQDLWSFCQRFQIELHDTVGQLLPARQEDQFLMASFIEAGYRGRDLRQLNECRMFLQVTTLSDISNAEGASLSQLAWSGTRDPRTGFYYEWPRPPPSLSSSHWSLWRKSLQKCFLSHSWMLSHPLGPWMKAPPARWQWYHSPSEDRIYAHEGFLWRVYPRALVRTSARLGARYLRSKELVDIPPEDLLLASVIQQGEHFRCTGTSAIFGKDRSHPSLFRKTKSPSYDFEQARQSWPQADQWAIFQISLPDKGVGMAAALRAGTAIAVSDGSFKDGFGTAAFVIEDSQYPSPQSQAIGVNTVPGSEDVNSAYRSEISGISGVIATVESVCLAHGVISGSIEVGLDGEQAMKACAGEWPLSASQADYDLLQDIRAKIARSSLTWHFRWIEGHQDDKIAFDSLDRWSQLNVICDGLAKVFWNHCSTNKLWVKNQAFGDENWSVWIQGEKLSHLDKQKLYELTFAERTKAYWHQKHSLPHESIVSINWDACSEAMSKLPFGKRRWLLKHITGFCGVGKMERQRGHQDHDECPRCGHSEDTEHVLTCNGTGAAVAFTLALQKLETHMRTISTAPEIRQIILRRLVHWRKHQHRHMPEIPFSDILGVHEAVRDQDAIGWYNFLLGRLSKRWADAQQRYLETLNKRNTGRRWTIAILAKIWDISWDMWEQRNGIAHDTLHPRRLAQLQFLKEQVTSIFEEGSNDLLPRDRRLFDKGIDTLLEGSDSEMQQWTISVLMARQRSASAVEDYKASLRAERALMQRWLHPASAPGTNGVLG